MILIGSRSLALRAPNTLNRKPLDFDWVCTLDEYNDWMEKNAHKVSPTKIYDLPEFSKKIVEGSTNLEFEIITPGHSSELLVDLVKNDPNTIETDFGLIPSLDILFAIKDSHKYKKFHLNASGFWKTAVDWHMMRALVAEVKSEHKAFHILREAESYAAQKHPKLNVSKEDFFKDDGVSYKYDHDDLHVSVAPTGVPAYTKYLKDNEPVLCDKNKFFALPIEDQLAGVVEEACTLAVERSLVPSGAWSSDYAFKFALAKTCSTITSGWFRKFGYDHIFDVLKLYQSTYTGYWNKFQNDVDVGLVKPFTGSKY